MEKLRVAIICHMSNRMIREHLRLKSYSIKNTIKRIIGRPSFSYSDYGTWNTISVKEYEKYTDSVEIHLIIPHPGMKDEFVSFDNNGIYYHCLCQSSIRMCDYRVNRKRISTLINRISPDLITIVGIETPFYSLSALDIDVNNVPLVVAMQTALSDPDFTRLFPIGRKEYEKMLSCEQRVIKHSNYIASDVEWFRRLVRDYNPSANFVRYYFCTDINIKIEYVQKEFDFVYWASSIKKAGIDALKAFVIASKKCKNLTLNLVGSFTNDFYRDAMAMLQEDGISKNVVFSGYFPSHEEALKQVQKSRFALVPIKIDIISSTIREAAMMRMPIVTFITKGTPAMNREKQCILLSDIGDYEDMANNMLTLMEKPDFCKTLADNAYDYAQQFFNNEVGAKMNIDMFKAVYNNFHYGEPIGKDIISTVF